MFAILVTFFGVTIRLPTLIYSDRNPLHNVFFHFAANKKKLLSILHVKGEAFDAS